MIKNNKHTILTTIFSIFVCIVTSVNLAIADSGYVSGVDHYSEGGINGLLKRFFTPGAFEAHNSHFYQDTALMWALIVSNVLIFLAYTIIPVALFMFMRRRKDLVFKKVFLLFALFIIMCGIHHIVHVLTFWYPIYYMQALVDVITAIVSVLTAIALFPILPEALKLRTPSELEKLNEDLVSEIDQRKETEAKLKKEIELRKIVEQKLILQNKEKNEALRKSESAQAQLEKINDAMVGRENKMRDLKIRIKELEKKIEEKNE